MGGVGLGGWGVRWKQGKRGAAGRFRAPLEEGCKAASPQCRMRLRRESGDIAPRGAPLVECRPAARGPPYSSTAPRPLANLHPPPQELPAGPGALQRQGPGRLCGRAARRRPALVRSGGAGPGAASATLCCAAPAHPLAAYGTLSPLPHNTLRAPGGPLFQHCAALSCLGYYQQGAHPGRRHPAGAGVRRLRDRAQGRRVHTRRRRQPLPGTG